MNLITRISSAPRQRLGVNVPSGGVLNFELYFSEMQQTWVFTEMSYGASFNLYGLRCCLSPNLLNQWRNTLPFGLGCFGDGNRDPSLLEDFSSGAVKLYLLSPEEAAEYAEYLSS